MKRILIPVVCFMVSMQLFAQYTKQINVPYEEFKLGNGLRVIVHEDHKAPIVAVNIWYHTGSKNEKPGKTGFAHLFEHLMFNGSENFNDDYFQALERLGGTDLNGTTNRDRTNYFQNVPVNAFDAVMWLESDRMGHLIGAITQAKLDEQRGVVQNEKRQGEDQPYSIADEIIAKNTYPAGHPYSWTTIGSMEDLNAAKLEDVHEWFKSYYGAANAVLVIAGDITVKEAKEKAEKYFGDIPPGPPVERPQTWVAKMSGEKRHKAEDRVPQARLIQVWNIPEYGSKELCYLDFLSDVLSSGKTSRLYKRLVYKEQIATDVSASVDPGEIGSQFYIQTTAKPGVELSTIEKIVNEELTKLLKEGPTAEELERVKTQYFANVLRSLERIGGFGGKSDLLAENAVYSGTPAAFKSKFEVYENASISDLKNAGEKWLSDGVFVVEIQPYPDYQANEQGADRKSMPKQGEAPDAKFPAFEKFKLSNGLEVTFAKVTSAPLVNMTLLIPSGFASDKMSKPGLASMALGLLDEGTTTRDALTISKNLADLGARLSTSASIDFARVELSSLSSNLDKSLELFTDVLLNPSFPENELDRLRKDRLAGIEREKKTPVQMALRVFPKLLFGADHPYGTPFSGSGFSDAVKTYTREDMVNFHKTWFKPGKAKLIVVGDIDAAALKTKLEKALKDWKQGSAPDMQINDVKLTSKPTIYIVDKPGTQQSVIIAGTVVPGYSKDEIAVQTANNILGGVFTSRINMNLREDKHWSYGSGSTIFNTQNQRLFVVYGFVQTDKTKESLLEIKKELKDYVSGRPATDEEINKIKSNQVLELAGSWETMNAVKGSLEQLVVYRLPENYYSVYSSTVKNLSKDDISKAAGKIVLPDNVTWVVVGDKNKIEAGLKETGYEIKYLDADGNVK